MDIIYTTLGECAALHPDEDQDDEEDNDGHFLDVSNEEELTEDQQAKLRHLESMFTDGSATNEEPQDDAMRKRAKHDDQ